MVRTIGVNINCTTSRIIILTGFRRATIIIRSSIRIASSDGESIHDDIIPMTFDGHDMISIVLASRFCMKDVGIIIAE